MTIACRSRGLNRRQHSLLLLHFCLFRNPVDTLAFSGDPCSGFLRYILCLDICRCSLYRLTTGPGPTFGLEKLAALDLSADEVGTEPSDRRLTGLVMSEAVELSISAGREPAAAAAPKRMLCAAALKHGSILLLEVCPAAEGAQEVCRVTSIPFTKAGQGKPDGGECAFNCR